MTCLLDTHTLLWALYNTSRLSRAASSVLADERNELYVSAASAWEIATKVRRGRLTQAERLEANFVASLETAGFGLLVGGHGDPFDRMIAAQALAEDIAVISNDAKLDGFGVRRIW